MEKISVTSWERQSFDRPVQNFKEAARMEICMKKSLNRNFQAVPEILCLRKVVENVSVVNRLSDGRDRFLIGKLNFSMLECLKYISKLSSRRFQELLNPVRESFQVFFPENLVRSPFLLLNFKFV